MGESTCQAYHSTRLPSMALSHEERPYQFMRIHFRTLLPVAVLAERPRHQYSTLIMLLHYRMALTFRVQTLDLLAVGVEEEVDFVRMIQSRGELSRKLRCREYLTLLQSHDYLIPVTRSLRIRYRDISLEY